MSKSVTGDYGKNLPPLTVLLETLAQIAARAAYIAFVSG
jgi:hypothetical protein